MVGHPLKDEYWKHGGTPEPSYVLPMSIHTPRASNIRAPSQYEAITDPWQGTLTEEFVEKITEEIVWKLRKQ